MRLRKDTYVYQTLFISEPSKSSKEKKTIPGHSRLVHFDGYSCNPSGCNLKLLWPRAGFAAISFCSVRENRLALKITYSYSNPKLNFLIVRQCSFTF